MKTNQNPDKRIHIRKKVAGGTTGAVLGAVVGGPVGALVGGVIGTVVGGAAESGKLQALATSRRNNDKPVAKIKSAAKRVSRNAPKVGKVVKRKARGVRQKGKSRSQR